MSVMVDPVLHSNPQKKKKRPEMIGALFNAVRDRRDQRSNFLPLCGAQSFLFVR